MTMIKQVAGLYYSYSTGEKELKLLNVRITQSHKGETISIEDEQRGIMLEVPLEPILKELKKGAKK